MRPVIDCTTLVRYHQLVAILFCLLYAQTSLGFGFTRSLFRVVVYQTSAQDINVMPLQFRMGIDRENLSSTAVVSYKLSGSTEAVKTFLVDSKRFGDFEYVMLKTSFFGGMVNREVCSQYNLTVTASLTGSAETASTNVLVDVLDKNDNCPIFTKEIFRIRVFSDVSIGQEVGRVMATDADTGINAEIYYFLKPISSEEFPFSVEAQSGSVRGLLSLTRMSDREISVDVFAGHRGDQSLISCSVISRARLSIRVQTPYYMESPPPPPRITLTPLPARFHPDFDGYDYAEVTVPVRTPPVVVSINGSSPRGLFFQLVPRFTPHRFLLRLHTLYSVYIMETSASITLQATDRSASSRRTFKLDLAPLRDLRLLPLPILVTLRVPETAIVHSVISLLRAFIPPTRGADLVFTLQPDPEGAHILRDIAVTRSGVVRLTEPLDAENYGLRRRNLTVGVSVSFKNQHQRNIIMQVLVLDVNEFGPVVSNNDSVVRVPETAHPGHVIVTIEAYDPDVSRTQLHYYLHNEAELPFRLDDNDPRKLVLTKPLDAETMVAKYSVRVLVSDSGLPLPRSVVANYEVELTDHNEFKPEFVYRACNISVNRHLPYGYSLGEFKAEDMDRGGKHRIKVSIKSISLKDPCFNLHGKSGKLTLLCSLRNRAFKNVTSFSVVLQATDGQFVSSELHLAIRIVDPHSVELAPGEPMRKSCSESDIYRRLEANFNAINRNSGARRVSQSAESMLNELDSSSRRDAPRFVRAVPSTIHVREELALGHVVAELQMAESTHRDGYESLLRFGAWPELENGYMAFMLEPQGPRTARLVIRDRVDHEWCTQYRLRLAVCDCGQPPLCTEASVLVKVENINDNAPFFTDSFLQPIALPENYGVNERIVHINAQDRDDAEQASAVPLHYRLLNHRGQFRVQKKTGWLRLKSALDREQRDQFVLLVSAADSGSPLGRPRTGTATLTLTVTDVNDNTPQFGRGVYRVTVPGDLPDNAFMLQLQAHDRDSGSNARLSYEVVGLGSECVRCDPASGAVYLATASDKDSCLAGQKHRLFAVAKDGGGLVGQSELHLTVGAAIGITGINDNPPVSTPPLMHIRIYEGQPVGYTLLTLKHIDPDRPKDDKNESQYHYVITSDSSGLPYFSISSTGEIFAISILDRERTPNFWLYAYVEDRNAVAPGLKSSFWSSPVVRRGIVEIFIELNDVNDIWPLPTLPEYRVSVSEHSGINSLKSDTGTDRNLLTITGHDEDLGENAQLKYRIISGDPMGYFSISKEGLLVTTERIIDREAGADGDSYCKMRGNLELKVTISDSGYDELKNVFSVFVTVEDINDNAPEFIHPDGYNFTNYLSFDEVHEPEMLTMTLGRVVAMDRDQRTSLNSVVRYTMDVSANPDGGPGNDASTMALFYVNGTTGQLFFRDQDVISELREKMEENNKTETSLIVKVWALDLGDPSLWSAQPAEVRLHLLLEPISNNDTRLPVNVTSSRTGLYLSYALPENRMSVLFDQCVGSELLPLPIVDKTDPTWSAVQIRIRCSEADCPFAIVMKTSTISKNKEASLVIAQPLDSSREKYTVKIHVRNTAMFFETVVTFHVMFYSISRPVFMPESAGVHNITIPDQTAVNSVLFTTKLEPDSNLVSSGNNDDPVIFSITASNDPETVKNLFYLHSNNGQLSLSSSAELERGRQFWLLIEARRKTSAYMKLGVFVADSNGAAPVIHQWPFPVRRLFLAEMARVASASDRLVSSLDRLATRHWLANKAAQLSWFGSVHYQAPRDLLLTTVVATDADFGINARLQFTFLDGNGSTLFWLNRWSGELRVAASLESVRDRVFYLMVQVADSGTPALTSPTVVGVHVQDEWRTLRETSLPELESDNVQLEVPEGGSSQRVVHCLRLVTPYSGAAASAVHFVAVQHSGPRLFVVTRDTGCLMTTASIDREVLPRTPITMQVRVQNARGQFAKYNSQALITFHIVDVNDNAPRFLIPLEQFGVISEAAHPGSLVFLDNKEGSSDPGSSLSSSVLIMRAADADVGRNGEFDYLLDCGMVVGDNTDCPFQVDQHTGALKLARPIDREVQSEVRVRVSLLDRGRPHSMASAQSLSVRVRVQDVNDCAPRFQRQFYVETLTLPTYPGARIARLQATDLDLSPPTGISYLLDPEANTVQQLSFFSLDTATGWLSVTSSSARAARTQRRVQMLIVQATDTVHTTRVNVTLYCTPDPGPRLLLETVNVAWAVPENVPPVSAPYLMLPRTLDYQTNIRYILLSGGEDSGLSVDADIGVLRLTRPLDRERHPTLELAILTRAWDGRQARINVIVRVTDVNDFRPLFLTQNHRSMLVNAANFSRNSTGIQIRAIDLDAGENGTLTYSLESVKPYSDEVKFRINSTSGWLDVTELTRTNLVGNRYILTVKATDNGRLPLSAFTSVTVDMVSDRSPLFEKANYTVQVWEDTSPGTVLATLQAASSTGHTIMYTISIGNEDQLFELDFNTGVLRLVGHLDYEKRTEHSVTVLSTDPSSSLSHSTTVTVHVLNRDDEVPQFQQKNYSTYISELAVVDMTVLLFTVKKNSHNYNVSYSIKDKDDSSYCGGKEFFRFKKISDGELVLTSRVDYETCLEHSFWVVATFNNLLRSSSSMMVTVKIKDENDNAPRFSQPYFSGSVSDSSLPGSLVAVAMATDEDTHTELHYKLLEETSHLFEVESNTGFIRLLNRPSADTFKARNNTIKFRVLVHDTVYSTFAPVTVRLVMTINRAPVFEKALETHMEIVENATVDSTVGQLNAVDSDHGDSVRYALVGGHIDHFKLDPSTGLVSTKMKLDREERKKYEFRALATDGRGGNDFVNVLVHVIDINDNNPVFKLAYYEMSVDTRPLWSTPIWQFDNQMVVGRVQAEDPDHNPRFVLEYSVLIDNGSLSSPTTESGDISMDPQTGTLTLHREPGTSHNSTGAAATAVTTVRMVVQACKMPALSYRFSAPPLLASRCSRSVPVTLHLWRRDLHFMPVITCALRSIEENNAINALVAMCRTNSPKAAQSINNSSTIITSPSWSLVPNQRQAITEAELAFEIDPRLGHVRARRVLNHELDRGSDLELTVQFRASYSLLVAWRTIRVDLLDQNDCSPRFDNTRYSISVLENARVGSRVLQCVAHDPDLADKDQLTYSIIDSSIPIKAGSSLQPQFQIDAEGWISVHAPLDYENRTLFNLQVRAEDTAGHLGSANVSVRVLDVNDYAPFWVRDHDSVTLREQDGRLAKSAATADFPKPVYWLQLKDNDSDSSASFRFFIVNQAAHPLLSRFIVSDNGQVLLTEPLDAEQMHDSQQKLELHFVASDSLFWTHDQFKLEVMVEDVNDNAPVCIQPTAGSLFVYENSAPGTKIWPGFKATDADVSTAHNRLKFRMLHCSEPHLLIVQEDTGALLLNGPLDRETLLQAEGSSSGGDVIKLEVAVTDPGDLSCRFGPLEVRVIDMNDNPPRFTHTQLAPLPENAPYGSVVGKLHAVDEDAGKNRAIEYKLEGGQSPAFSIDRTTGIVRVASLLDREREAVHSLLVSATDGGGLVTTTTVLLTLLDVNDSPPVFIGGPLRTNVSEDAQVGTVVATVRAVSADAGINARIRYRLVALAIDYRRLGQQPHFSVDAQSGQLVLERKLDYETMNEFFLTVEASDGGTPSLSSSAVMTVSLEDINDNKPKFPTKLYWFTLQENVLRHTLVGKITALDADSGANGRVLYSLLGWTSEQKWLNQSKFQPVERLFSLEPESGALHVLFQPDRELQSFFRLLVSATDRGQHPQSSTGSVLIEIEDINDNAARLDKEEFSFLVQVDRDGIIPENAFKKLANSSLLQMATLPIRDLDGPQNSIPFTCQLLSADESTTSAVVPQLRTRFVVRIDPSSAHHCQILLDQPPGAGISLGVHTLVVQIGDHATLPVGKRLFSRSRLRVHTVRLSNIPPAIEPLNVSLSYLPRAPTKGQLQPIARVGVRDRSQLYDMLIRFQFVINTTHRATDSRLLHFFSLDPTTGLISARQQLESGLYPLEVMVTNGSLSAQRVLYIKVTMLTDEMVQSGCVLRFSRVSMTEFVARRLHQRVSEAVRQILAAELVYLVAMKVATSSGRFSGTRHKRSSEQVPRGRDGGTEVLVAVYNEHNNRFFLGKLLAQKLGGGALTRQLDSASLGPVLAFADVCSSSTLCVQGRCRTRFLVNADSPLSSVRGGQYSVRLPPLRYEPECRCEAHFGGRRCEVPLNKCAHRPCAAPHICRPQSAVSPGFQCVCPAGRSGRLCERVVGPSPSLGTTTDNTDSGPISFSGGGFIRWLLGNTGGRADRLELQFGFRVARARQDRMQLAEPELRGGSPLLEVEWTELRQLRLLVTPDGGLALWLEYRPTGGLLLLTKVEPTSRGRFDDLRWHSVRLALVPAPDDTTGNSWWLQLVLDGLVPKLLSLAAWTQGHPQLQNVTLAARALGASPPLLLRDSAVGCFRDVLINKVRPPYQQWPAWAEVRSTTQTTMQTTKQRRTSVSSRNLQLGCSDVLLRSACGANPCDNAGQCLLSADSMMRQAANSSAATTATSFVCRCQSPFEGVLCRHVREPCQHRLCQNSERCIETREGTFSCESCPEGSDDCITDDACSESLNPCPKYATCEQHPLANENTASTCRCPTTHRGYRCQDDVDECHSSKPVCRVGRGLCHNVWGSYQCNCSLGYAGHHCELETLVPIHRDSDTALDGSSLGGLSRFHIYLLVGLLACLFVLALLTVVVLLLRLRPGRRRRLMAADDALQSGSKMGSQHAGSTALLSLDPLYHQQYKYSTTDGCSHYSPTSSMLGSALQMNSPGGGNSAAGYIGGYLVEPPPQPVTVAPSTPGGHSQHSANFPSQWRRPSAQDPADRMSLYSGGEWSQHQQQGNNTRYQKSNRHSSIGGGNPYHPNSAAIDPRHRLSQHSSTFSLLPCSVGPQQHVHLVPNPAYAQHHPQLVNPHHANIHPAVAAANRNSVFIYPNQPQHKIAVYDPIQQQQMMMLRNSNLSLHSARVMPNIADQWNGSHEAVDMHRNTPGSVNLPHHPHPNVLLQQQQHQQYHGDSHLQLSPLNGEADHSIISWNGQYNDEGVPNREMVSSQEMSLTETTERSTAFLIPKPPTTPSAAAATAAAAKKRSDPPSHIIPSVPAAASTTTTKSCSTSNTNGEDDEPHVPSSASTTAAKDPTPLLTNGQTCPPNCDTPILPGVNGHHRNPPPDASSSSPKQPPASSSNNVSPSTASLPSHTNTTNSSASPVANANPIASADNVKGLRRPNKVSADSNSGEGTECDTEDLDLDQQPLSRAVTEESEESEPEQDFPKTNTSTATAEEKEKLRHNEAEEEVEAQIPLLADTPADSRYC